VLRGRSGLRRDLDYLILFSIILFMAIFVIFLSWGGVKEGEVGCLSISNPAAVYCKSLGYRYRLEGNVGYCIFPDNNTCEEWSFYSGKCGQKWSYCVRHGYGLETRRDGRDPYSMEYSACILPDKTRKPASELMRLEDKISRCEVRVSKESRVGAP